MIVRMNLFALAKEICGASSLELTVPEQAQISDVRRALVSTYPAFAPLMSSAMFAIDTEYVSDDFPLNEGVQVACILPVSGG